MYCKICNNFFQPARDIEKLIVSGAIEELCDACAAKQWAKSVEKQKLPAFAYPGTEMEGDGTQLYRADWFNPDGTRKAFMALPPKPLRPSPFPLHPNKVGDLSVMVMSEYSYQRLGEPTMNIRTNLECFRTWDPPVLWIQKSSDHYDSFTGVGRIEVPANHVIEVIRADRQVDIKLIDGSFIRLLFF